MIENIRYVIFVLFYIERLVQLQVKRI